MGPRNGNTMTQWMVQDCDNLQCFPLNGGKCEKRAVYVLADHEGGSYDQFFCAKHFDDYRAARPDDTFVREIIEQQRPEAAEIDPLHFDWVVDISAHGQQCKDCHHAS